MPISLGDMGASPLMMQPCRTALVIVVVVALPPGCDTAKRWLVEREARVLAAKDYNDCRMPPLLDADGNPLHRPVLTPDSWQQVTKVADGEWKLSVVLPDGTRITSYLYGDGNCTTETIHPGKMRYVGALEGEAEERPNLPMETDAAAPGEGEGRPEREKE